MFKSFATTGDLTMSALEGGMCRDTAKKYQAAGKLPSEMKQERDWRTRKDPFAEVWPAVAEMLADMPELEGKVLFEYLQDKYPGSFADGQLRTLQRRIRQWLATEGPSKEVFFSQIHAPGKVMQLDWMHTSSLGLTVRGRPYEPLLCHSVMQYSNWEWATVCTSESYLSLQRTLQESCLRLGGVPAELVTDNSSAATHRIEKEKRERGLNDAYEKLLAHYNLRGRATNLGCPHENGTAESMHGHLRSRLKQALLLRGHADFDDEQAFMAFLHEHLNKANGNRLEKVQIEQAALRALPAALPNWQSVVVTVGSGSTINVKKTTYSVPSRLIGRKVEVRIIEDEIEVRLGNEVVCTRLRAVGGKNGVDYKDLVAQMLRKPGAFAAYRWRDAFFPRQVFRELYTSLQAQHGDGTVCDLAYLRILDRAVRYGEERVAEFIREKLNNREAVDLELLDQALDAKPAAPKMDSFDADPSAYDRLLGAVS